MADAIPLGERALARICEVFQAQAAGAPVSDPVRRAYDFDWKTVQRAAIDEENFRQENTIAILEGVETVEPGAQYVRRTMSITLDFRYFRRAEDEPSTIFQRVRAELIRRIREDHTLGGLVEDVRELQSTPDIDDGNDLMIGGQVFVNIVYKTSENDLTIQRVGSAAPADPAAAVP